MKDKKVCAYTNEKKEEERNVRRGGMGRNESVRLKAEQNRASERGANVNIVEPVPILLF